MVWAAGRLFCSYMRIFWLGKWFGKPQLLGRGGQINQETAHFHLPYNQTNSMPTPSNHLEVVPRPMALSANTRLKVGSSEAAFVFAELWWILRWNCLLLVQMDDMTFHFALEGNRRQITLSEIYQCTPTFGIQLRQGNLVYGYSVW